MLAMICSTLALLMFLVMNPLMPTVRTYKPKVGNCNPGTPLVVSAGGTYSGCYESRDPNVPAVQINTASAVTFSRATIRHKGQGIRACCSDRADLTVQDTTFTAISPGTPTFQNALYAYQPTAITLDNNQFTDGHGVTIGGNNLTTSPLLIRRNNFVNVGRYDQPACCLGAVHFDQVSAPNGATISWNRATNTYGQSLNEDVIGIFQSNGASGNPITIDHNLINGSYPISGNGASFTGSGINIGDSSGTWQTGDSNTVVNSANIGIAIATDTTGSNLTHTNSTVVMDGKAGINDSGTTVSSTFGNGVNCNSATVTNATITNNQSGQRRWNGTSFEAVDYYIPNATTASGNTNISPVNAAAEQSAVDAWETARAAASVTVGPR